jgi:transposase
VGRVGFALAPLVERLKHLLRQQNMLHADETPVAQLDPGQGKTKRAYLWAYRSVDSPHSNAPRLVVFDYQSGRAGKHAANFLQDWKGELMVDDYAGYKALFTSGITELGCWAHVRRKFFDIQAASPHPRASQALAQIGALYDIERQAQDQNMGANQRAQLRREQAQPKLAQLLDWLNQTLQSSAPNSAIARAASYALKRWSALTRYADNGQRPIGRVEMWRGDLRSGLSVGRPFRLAVPEYPRRNFVSTSPSSNRTCGSPASGSLATHQTFAFKRSRAVGTRRISPNVL